MSAITFHVTEPAHEDLLPEPFGAEAAQFGYPTSWATLDPSMEAMRLDHSTIARSLERNSLPNHSYFSSYDGAAHGFKLENPLRQAEKQLYHLGLDSEWRAYDHLHRHARYVSPSSSGSSLSNSESPLSDFPSTPDPHSDGTFFTAPYSMYPSPVSYDDDDYQPAYFQQPLNTYGFVPAVLPSQSFSMAELQYNPDALVEEELGVDEQTVTVNQPAPTDIRSDALHEVEDADNNESSEIEEEDEVIQDPSDNDSEFNPSHKSWRQSAANARPQRSLRRMAAANLHHVQDPAARIQKSSAKTIEPKPRGRKPQYSSNHPLASTTKHKSFPCPFSAFGCTSIFPNKNEWKRHTASQHLQLGFYRCDLGACNPEHPSQITQTRGFNDFNRKDLFTQHCRRMHYDECEGIKASKVKGKDYSKWTAAEKQKYDNFMDGVRERCWMKRRDAPKCTRCGICERVFDDGERDEDEAGRAWDERVEHVGRHYEKGQQEQKGWVDEGLRDWAVENEILVEVGGRFWMRGSEPEDREVVGRKGGRRGLRNELVEKEEEEEEKDVKIEDEVKETEHDDTDAEGEDE